MADEFLTFISNKNLVIHNAEFDISHLNNELKLIGKQEIKNEVIDTLILARNKFPGSQNNLDALCKRYKIDNSKRTNHTALIDCDLLAKIYINLIDQKEPTLNFNNQDQIFDDTQKGKVNYCKKVYQVKPEEIENHKKYIKKYLKGNFFS